VIGAGAVGTCVAWNLVRAGRDVTVCARKPVDHLVLQVGDDEPVALPASSASSPAEVGRQDWVLVATKAQDTASAQPWLEAAAGPGTVIVLLQNGIDHASRIARLPDGAAALPALVHINLEPVARGQARQRAGGEISVPAGEQGSRLAGLFAGTGITIRLEQDFRAAAWRKLLGNVAHNPILTLTGRRADVFTEPDVLALAARLISEAAAVAAAEGVVIGDQQVSGIVAGLGALPTDAGNSMLFDRLRGRALESEFLTGAVVRAGHAAGVPTPLNEAMLTLLRAISRGVGREVGSAGQGVGGSAGAA
jgi:2-dehydropantoate 2-reductase